MKKLILLMTLFSFISNIAFGDCDWSTIKKNPDNSYTYSAQLNLCVGNLVQQNSILTQQVADYQKAISLKDLAITASDQRIALWQKTSDDEQSRLAKMDADQKMSSWLYFGLGALTVIGTGFALGAVTHK